MVTDIGPMRCPRCGDSEAIEISNMNGWDTRCEFCDFFESFVLQPADPPYEMSRYSWKRGYSIDQAKFLTASELETALSSLRGWIRRGRIPSGTVYFAGWDEATRQLDFLLATRASFEDPTEECHGRDPF
jgi:hypothetical protein